MKKLQSISILAVSLALVVVVSPIEVSATLIPGYPPGGGDPGSVIKHLGDPIPDIDITIDQSPGGTIATGNLTNIAIPDDNAELITRGMDSHTDVVELKDNVNGEERIIKQEGTITIMKRLPDHPLNVIEHRMKSGTVKFFNETKSVGWGHVDNSPEEKERGIGKDTDCDGDGYSDSVCRTVGAGVVAEIIARTPNGDKVIGILKGIRN